MFVKDESLLGDTTNFQIFMTIMSEKEAIEKRIAVEQISTLLFPSYKLTFTPRSMLFMKSSLRAFLLPKILSSFLRIIE